MLKLPPYLSFLCVIVGVVWLLLLPLDDYARKTYISENALLPGQVHTYFGGSEQNVLRAYRRELEIFADASGSEYVCCNHPRALQKLTSCEAPTTSLKGS